MIIVIKTQLNIEIMRRTEVAVLLAVSYILVLLIWNFMFQTEKQSDVNLNAQMNYISNSLKNQSFILQRINMPEYKATPFFLFLHDPNVDIYESKDLIFGRPWHSHLCSLFRDFLKSNNETDLRILDIGGNMGFFSFLLVSMSRTVSVISIEPSKNHLSLFRASLKVNDPSISNRIEIVENAVGSTDSKVVCMTAEATNAAATTANAYDSTKRCDDIAHQVTINKILHDRNIMKIDVVKMDIEGYEYFAMQGASVEG